MKPLCGGRLRVSFQASILFGRATADVAQQHRISKVDELPSRSTDSISRGTNRIEYSIGNCPAKSQVGGFLQTSLSKVIRRSRLRCSPALSRRITPDRVIAFIGIDRYCSYEIREGADI